jgi:hypothetical protein
LARLLRRTGQRIDPERLSHIVVHAGGRASLALALHWRQSPRWVGVGWVATSR